MCFNENPDAPEVRRAPYQSPEFLIYGDVAALTQANAGLRSTDDSGGAANKTN
jgi:hypothetical protein